MSDHPSPARSSPRMARVAAMVAVLIAGLATGPGNARATTFPASDYSNVTAFDTCDGTPDTISRSLESLAESGLSYLGYAAGEYTTTGFTRARVLSRAPADQAIYVHSHGDQYYDPYPKQVQGFREDGRLQPGHRLRDRPGRAAPVVRPPRDHVHLPPRGGGEDGR